jgi:serine O-acetyltransferase
VGFAERAASHIAARGWHAVRLYRLSRWLHLRGHRAAALLVFTLNRVLTGVEIPPSAEFGPGLVIMHGQGIVVHACARAGRDCVLYQQATIGVAPTGGAAPTIGDGVEIFPGARVIGAITIGDRARIGANTVVTHDVPPSAVVKFPA